MTWKAVRWIGSLWSRFQQRRSPPSLGPWGERIAAAWLARRGYHILAHRFRTRYGEIDLIARQGNTVIFVEVKARTRFFREWGWEILRPSQRRRLLRAARAWIRHYAEPGLVYRFDLIVVVVRPHQAPKVIWFPHAWSDGGFISR